MPQRRMLMLAPLAFLATAAAPGGSSARPSAAERMAQRMLDELVAINGVPGMGAAVWANGKVVWQGSAGYRDREQRLPVTADTVFRLASVSKLLTVTATAKLAEQGKLDLDAPVGAQLPWLRNDWPTITARQLAAHTAGLPHYQAKDSNRGAAHFRTGRDAVRIFADRPLLAPPGQAYSYSSWGYTLLGALVEHASGKPFVEYVTSEVTPGLAVMGDPTDSGHRDAATAYEWTGGAVRRAPAHDFSYTWGGGGMAATPGGIVRFGGAMLEDRVVSRATFDRMLVPARLADGRPAGEQDYTVGFGWRISTDRDGRPTVLHNGVTVGARSSLVLWRDENVAASVLSNMLWTSSIDLTAQMLAAPFRKAPALAAADCPTTARRYAGTIAGEPVAGAAHFTREDGLCVGTIEPDAALAQFFKGAEQAGPPQIRIVGIDGRGGIGRAGLVTPYGIYDLRAGADRRFAVRLSSQRELVLGFAP